MEELVGFALVAVGTGMLCWYRRIKNRKKVRKAGLRDRIRFRHADRQGKVIDI